MSSKRWCRWHSHLTPVNTRERQARITNNHGLPVSPALQPPHQKPAREHQTLESLTPFRKAVAANLYANALASPIRQCNFTGSRLPSHYLLPFTTVFRPNENGKLVPHLAPVEKTRQTSRSYAFNSRSLLYRLGQKKTWQRLLGSDLKFGIKNRNDYQWPDSIDDTVLFRLRQSVVKKLSWILSKPKARLVVPHESIEEAPPSACILYLHAEDLPPSLVDTSVKVYRLQDLLGQEKLEELIKDTSFANHGALVLTQSYMTVSAHTALARLSTFLSSSHAASSPNKV